MKSNPIKDVSHSMVESSPTFDLQKMIDPVLMVESAPSDYDYPIFAPTTTTIPSVCSGSINLFSKTYNRGSNLTISEDTPDLGKFQFANQLVSLDVSGDCCWQIFTETNYTGDSKQFTSSGTFLSTTSVGPLFRNAASVRRC